MARVLIVEDEIVTALRLQESLEQFGHHVVDRVRTGADAIARIPHMNIDLIVMDVQLEGNLDGIATARQLRARGVRLPIVFLTASTAPDILQQAIATNPFGYLIKPFNETELYSTVTIALYRYQLERQLEQSEQQFATTLASLGDGAIATDAKGHITFINPVAETLTGWRADESLGKPSSQVLCLIDSSTGNPVDNPILKAIEDGQFISLLSTCVLRTKDGTERPISDTAAPIRNADGEIVGGILVFQDATERRQAEVQSREFRALVENSPDVIARFDRTLRYLYINPSMEKATGIPSQAFIGRTNSDLFMPADVVLPWHFALTQALETAQEQSTEFDLVTADGVRSYQVRIVPELNANNQVESLLSVARDVTEYKQAEERLRQQAKREKVVATITQRIHRSLDLQEILTPAVHDIRHWLGTDRVVIYQFDSKGGGRVIVESVDSRWPSMDGQAIYDYCLVQEQCIQPYQNGEVSSTPDIHAAGLADCYVELLDRYAVQANLIIPILLGTQLWGLLAVQHCEAPRQWQVPDIELLQQIAAQLAIAIQQSQLYQKIQWQAEQAQSLNRLLQGIRNSLDVNVVFNDTVREIGQLLQVEQVVLAQFRRDENLWVSVASYSCDPGRFPLYLGLEIPHEQHGITRHLIHGESIQVNDTRTLDGEVSQILAETFPGAWSFFPLNIDGQVWGYIHLIKMPEPFTWMNWQMEFMKIAVNQLEIAIQQSILYQQVQQLNANLEQQVCERTFELQQAFNYEATLKRITDRVRDSFDEDQILQTVVAELAIAVDALTCDVSLYNPEQRTSTICYEYTTTLSPFQGRCVSMSGFPEGYQQLLRGQYFQFCPLPTTQDEPRFARLVCPIVDDQSVLGDLWLLKQGEDLFPDAQIRLVQQVANQCAIALRQSRLYQTAQGQVEELEYLNHLKDDFLSTVSHELRTPMASIKMALHMLHLVLEPTGILADSTSPVRRYFKILQDECQRETNLINDLLNLSQLESGVRKLTLSTIYLQNWLSSILQPFNERCQQQQQTFIASYARSIPALRTDATYLERILTELLTNACKYTPPQETIQLTVQPSEAGVLIQVQNSSSEIPHHELERIFDKFYRVPQGDRWQHGGTGLGLALVKRMVVDLQGSIEVSSDPAWTTFTLYLPWSIEE